MDTGEKLVKKPTYPGGRKAMDAFIKANLQYPEKALEKKVHGTVSVVIDIDGNGHVLRGRIKKKLGSGCDEEALRVCKLLKFSTGPKRKARRITFHRTINIHFRLPKKKVQKKTPVSKKSIDRQAKQMQVVYTFIPKKK